MNNDKTDMIEITSNEERILRALAAGLTNQEIAKQVGITESTLWNCLLTIRRKINAESYQRMVVWAVRRYG